jgi:hypothetical protein
MGWSRSEVHIVRDDAVQFRAGLTEPTEYERRFERTCGSKTIGSTFIGSLSASGIALRAGRPITKMRPRNRVDRHTFGCARFVNRSLRAIFRQVKVRRVIRLPARSTPGLRKLPLDFALLSAASNSSWKRSGRYRAIDSLVLEKLDNTHGEGAPPSSPGITKADAHSNSSEVA